MWARSRFSVRGIGRPSIVLFFGVGVLLGVSPRARLFAQRWLGTVAAFAILAGALAFLLSLGPEIRTNGRLIGEAGPYSLLYSHVPGFDGLRVPARYAMIVTLCLAIAAGIGADVVVRRFRRGSAIAAVLGAACLERIVCRPDRYSMVALPRVATSRRRPGYTRAMKSLPSTAF